MNIIQDLLPLNQQNRPSMNPKSSRYKIIIPPKWITIHNAWSPWDAYGLNEYQKTGGAITRPASWHLSVDDKVAVQGIPFGETAWHAGDYVNVANPGVGNTQSIGIEICDFYNGKTNDQSRYLLAEAYSTLVVAYLIRTVPSLLPFPECVVPHTKWRPASGCPSRILGRKDGWEHYLARVGEALKGQEESTVIQKEIEVRLDHKPTQEIGYLINNATYVRAAYLMGLTGRRVTGHGTYINIPSK